jgi:hypothetical protein
MMGKVLLSNAFFENSSSFETGTERTEEREEGMLLWEGVEEWKWDVAVLVMVGLRRGPSIVAALARAS